MKSKFLRLSALLAAFLLAMNLGFSQEVIGPTLYEQLTGFDYTTYPTKMYATQYTDVATKGKSVELADDFTVPTGETWDIGYVKVYGYRSSYKPALDSANVYIYSNADTGAIYDNPGDVLFSFMNLIDTVDITTVAVYDGTSYKYDDVTIKLPSTVSLTAGKYWIVVQPLREGAYSPDGYYNIFTLNNTATMGDAFMGRNPLLGQYGWTADWSSGEVFNSYASSFNLCFGIYAPLQNNDLVLASINTPASGAELSATDTVNITVFNSGVNDIVNFDASFSLDGGTTWTTETVTATLATGDVLDYTFAATVDLSVMGDYEITVKVDPATDDAPDNNQLSKDVTNYGVVYLWRSVDTVTSCSGYFTDEGGPVEPAVVIPNDDVYDTMVFYPGGTDLRTRMHFLQFDIGWGEWIMFDGDLLADENAPRMDLRPDDFDNDQAFSNDLLDTTITATNADGAVTVVWKGTTSSYTMYDGWIAELSCYTPPGDNFSLYEIWPDEALVFDNSNVLLSVRVFNKGLTTQSKTLTFYENGTEIGTATTAELTASEYDTVQFVWTPSSLGQSVITVTIPDDEGPDADNSISLERVVYGHEWLVESFEEEKFPPKGWQTLGTSVRTNSPIDGQHLDWYLDIYSDTLVTPRIQINAVDSINFLASQSPWWATTLDILWSTSADGPWTLLENVALPTGWFGIPFVEFSVDISAAAGNNYIAFAWGDGRGFLDFVRGPKIFHYNNDLYAKDLTGNTLVNQYDTVTYSVTVENFGLNDVAEGDYNVNFMVEVEDGDDILWETQTGTALAVNDEITYNFDFVFEDAVTYKLYAEIDYADDEYLKDNKIYTTDIYALPYGTDVVDFGDFENIASGYPLNTSYDYGVTQTMYYPEEVGDAGAIIGLQYDYDMSNDVLGGKIAVEFWLMETDDTSMYAYTDNSNRGYFYPADNFTMVFNDSIELQGLSKGSIRIPFEQPFIYSGEKNLVVMAYQKNRTIYPNFLGTYYGTHLRSIKAGRGIEAFDLNDTTTLNSYGYYYLSDAYPNTTFFKNVSGLGEIAGNVYYATDSTPFEGVQVIYSNQTVATDADGYYQLRLIPEGDIDYTAVYFGYRDNENTVGVTQGFQTWNDIYMGIKPTVVVTGTVINSDYSAGVQGLDINLEGYDNYTVQTDANGVFTFDDVYANENYVLNMDLEHYYPYTNENVMTDENVDTLDLGTITLQEMFNPAYLVTATEDGTNMNVSWNKPYTAYDSLIEIYDYLYVTNTYTADMFEEVMMGNKYEVGGEGTITAVDVWFLDQPTGGDNEVTVRIYDENEELISESEPFIPNGGSYTDDLFEDYMTTVDVPDVAYNGTFYVMIHWPSHAELTDWLCFDRGWGDYPTPDVAVYRYPGETAQSFSETFGVAGMFSMNVQALTEDGNVKITNKSLDGYNVYRGLTSDMANVADWTKLNDSPVTSADNLVSFTDNTWDAAEAGYYSYAVEAIYTEENAVPSFTSTVDKGLFTNVTITVTSAISAVPEAHVELVNTNGNDLYHYVFDLDETGIANAEVAMGEYIVTASMAGHDVYNSLVTIDADNNSIAIELQELMPEAHTLNADVNDDDQIVDLSWEFGNTTQYAYDNGVALSGFSINANKEAWLGNYFPTYDAGNIVSVEMYGVSQDVNGYSLEVDFFNAADNALLGSSSTFEFNDADWTTVTAENISFSGPFYAMIHWNNESGNTDAIGITNEYESYGYYYGPLDLDGDGTDDTTAYMAMEEIGGEPGIFLLRVNANVTGKGVQTIDPASNNAISATINNSMINTVDLESPVKAGQPAVKTFMGFSVYLDDTEIATGVTDNTFTITSEFLTEDGMHVAGVQANFQTGSSAMTTTEFNYGGVNTKLTATVVGKDENPLSSTLVTITNVDDANITYVSITNTFGIAVFPEVMKGMYNVELSHSDYHAATYENVDFNMEEATFSGQLDWLISTYELPGLYSINVYPNPTKDITVLNNASGSMVSIYNAAGILVETLEVTSNAQRIDLSGYEAGSYIVKVRTDNEITNLKLNVLK